MINKFFLRGLGFFNDAYDLSVVNIVNIILKHQYKDEYTADMKSNVSTAALIGAVLGQLAFGFLGDMYGRKNCMVATCAILIVGGILTAAAYGGSDHGTLWFLVIARERSDFARGAPRVPYVACFFINKMGRKRIMLQGCTVMTVVFLILGIWWDEIKKSSAGFIVLFGLTLFFANFGPNMSTFVMPTEMYPTAIRSSCHGFSAAMGKAGASIGSYGFSLWVDNPSFGYVGTWFTFAGISVLTIVLTVFCMFDNNDEASVMDNDFKAKLAMEDDDVRKSFVSQMEEPINADDIGTKA
ncbi:hypothetical protein SPRG_21860 [Saprolegnia parasitica CBS 223.65]|uniref:Major facilitator superfamily (MFS) profile domain-containing protein n=1 Tax=Saprolegnia parasitica (strain CBS 223.65) TaxID=695850 RepID=A0A067BS63_SAPPC|nr:hypothetical protein SPRG_21860 [Saprolegnia parasitica CBS 223.65]KDO17512.1 hypothetical protein SPRG_21860 [Saprolegnia parasitica CBS 223.65]|eukprot:XP_012211778.1 hypothetical protein SPRG_21860 [Saprolegnia parasitica CBS 223.65]